MPHALVIGIDRYSARGVRPLKCAVNDAEVISQRLESAGFEVVTLTNEAATREAISWELERGLNERVTDEDDPVLICWCGHGMSDLSPNAKGEKGRGWSTFLLPFDADINRPLASAFAVQYVWANLDQLKTRRLLVMLDTCFSGSFADDGRGFAIGDARGEAGHLTDDFLRMEGHGRVVLSACGPNELARENPKHGHGNFTRAVLTVLEKGADTGDRRARVNELAAEICHTVQAEPGGAQTPTLHVSRLGADWSIPLPAPAPYHPPVPSWAFVGTSGGVGKTTLAMLTAELLAESGNTVLYLDADIGHFGGTCEWCQRSMRELGDVRTFADHVASFSRGKKVTPTRRQLSDRLLDVTPGYLRRHGCGKILLLPAARATDRVFAFQLVADIKDRRSNASCRQILDAAFDRGLRQGASCVVIDCGAQFDPLAVNCLAASHHPFIVAAARAGAKHQQEVILANCAQTVDDFNRLRVETVVNRVPSEQARRQHWGESYYGRGSGYHWLPFDPALFRNWEEGCPNFELGYDDLTHKWHEILVASDQNGCGGLHRDLLPSEWDRFGKWARWLLDNPGWAPLQRTTLDRALRRSYILASGSFMALGAGLTSASLHFFAEPRAADPSFLPQWLAITLAALSFPALLGNVFGARLLRRRRKVLDDVIKHSVSPQELRQWFSVPPDESPWWMVWKPSRRAAIEWLHARVVQTRSAELSADKPVGAPG